MNILDQLYHRITRNLKKKKTFTSEIIHSTRDNRKKIIYFEVLEIIEE